MRLKDAVENSVGRIKFMKEAKVAEARIREDGTDLVPTVEGWRGNDPVVTMMPDAVDRDAALNAARLVAVGYGCDLIVLTTEGWHPTKDHVEINPVTGRPWAQGEMQDVVEHHQGMERGIIVEALTITAVNKAGDVIGSVYDYEIVANPLTGRLQVKWQEPLVADNTEEGTTFGGRIADALVYFMNQENLVQAMLKSGTTGADFGLTDVETMAHADCAVTKSLQQAGFNGAVMLMSDDPQRAAIIQDSMANGPFFPDPEKN